MVFVFLLLMKVPKVFIRTECFWENPPGLEHTSHQGHALQANLHHPMNWLPIHGYLSHTDYTFSCFKEFTHAVSSACPPHTPALSFSHLLLTFHLTLKAHSFLMEAFFVNPDKVRVCPPSGQQDTCISTSYHFSTLVFAESPLPY